MHSFLLFTGILMVSPYLQVFQWFYLSITRHLIIHVLQNRLPARRCGGYLCLATGHAGKLGR